MKFLKKITSITGLLLVLSIAAISTSASGESLSSQDEDATSSAKSTTSSGTIATRGR